MSDQLGTFRQRVNVNFEVLVSAPESEFEGPPALTTDELQEAIENYVSREILGTLMTRSIVDVTAGRGPTSVDYYPPGAEIRPVPRRDGTVVEPIRISLAFLLPERVPA